MLRLRGTSTATVDEKGRLKLPTTFKADMDTLAQGEDRRVPRFYITSLDDGASARMYPLPAWEAIEDRLAALPTTNPAKIQFLQRTAYFGSVIELDAQGRFVIPPILREAAQLAGEVAVLGQIDHLDIWNRGTFESRMLAALPMSNVLAQLSDLGI